MGAGRLAAMKLFKDPNNLRDWENEVRRSVLWEADGVESSVAIVGADGLAFHVNGMCDGNAIDDVGTQVMLGLIGAGSIPSRETHLSSAWEPARPPVGWRTLRPSIASTSSSWSRRSWKWPAAAARSIATPWRTPRCD